MRGQQQYFATAHHFAMTEAAMKCSRLQAGRTDSEQARRVDASPLCCGTRVHPDYSSNHICKLAVIYTNFCAPVMVVSPQVALLCLRVR